MNIGRQLILARTEISVKTNIVNDTELLFIFIVNCDLFFASQIKGLGTEVTYLLAINVFVDPLANRVKISSLSLSSLLLPDPLAYEKRKC